MNRKFVVLTLVSLALFGCQTAKRTFVTTQGVKITYQIADCSPAQKETAAKRFAGRVDITEATGSEIGMHLTVADECSGKEECKDGYFDVTTKAESNERQYQLTVAESLFKNPDAWNGSLKCVASGQSLYLTRETTDKFVHDEDDDGHKAHRICIELREDTGAVGMLFGEQEGKTDCVRMSFETHKGAAH